MKRFYVFFVIFVLFKSMFCFAQQSVNIDNALDTAVSEIKTSVPSGVEIAVSRFASDSPKLSEWLVKETESRLMRIGKFKLLERNAKNLKIIDSEIDYQYSGNVDDSSMVELGYRLGAKYLVYGSFEQFGGLMQFTLKTTNVETGEIPVIVSYSINSSSKITELLGDEKELNSAEDYLNMIARCQKKLTSIESDKNKEIQNVTSNIFSKYQEEINTATAVEKMPWESEVEYRSSIEKNVSVIENKRDTELSGVESKVNIKYDNQHKMVELQMNKLIENLQNTSFVIKGSSVQVLLGQFNAEANPKNWPVSIKSLDKLVNYTYNGRRTVSDADVKTEYLAMESARKNDALEGEIAYKIVKGASSLDYEIKIISVRVNNLENGTTIINETVNQMIGGTSANAKLSGKSNYEKPAKTNSTPKVQRTDSNDSVASVKTSSAASVSNGIAVNPFLDSNWDYESDSGGKAVVKIESTLFEGEEFDSFKVSGLTGNPGFGNYQEIKYKTRHVIEEFLSNGDTIKFKVVGDGKTYRLSFRVFASDNGKNAWVDYADYACSFITSKGKVKEITIKLNRLTRMPWTDNIKYDKNKVAEIVIAPENITAKKSWDFEIFDVRIY